MQMSNKDWKCTLRDKQTLKFFLFFKKIYNIIFLNNSFPLSLKYGFVNLDITISLSLIPLTSISQIVLYSMSKPTA